MSLGENILVTGGAGFIGSSLTNKLVATGKKVTVYDNLCTGKKEHIEHHLDNDNFEFIEADLLNKEELDKIMQGKDFVFHLAANADIPYGTKHPGHDFEQNTVVTLNVLEAMRKHNVKKIAFSSTSACFGTSTEMPTTETYGPAFPESLYGASKLACEGFITSYCTLFGMQAWLFRFANIIGPNVTHGILADFALKLKNNPEELEVLGDGTQVKSYLHVNDCVDAMIFAIDNTSEKFALFNLGSDDQITVKEITDIVIQELAPNAKARYTGGDRGWKGDVPKMFLDNSKIKSLGWKPKYNSKDAVLESVKSLK